MGRTDEAALTDAIIEKAREYGRYGYRRVTALLRADGWTVNPKRVERIWRREYGGMKTDQLRRLKELEKENQRLRRAVSDLTLDKLILAEAARGN